MKRTGLIVATLGALMATPGLAQTYTQPVVQRDTVPVQLPQQQIRSLQRTLNQKGFSAGKVDGLWGKTTAAALKRFQAANALNPTGELDRTTELKLGMIAPGNRVATPVAVSGPAPTPVVVAPPTAPLPVAPPAAVVLTPTPGTATSTSMGAGSAGKQPKATSGANSFTEGQARDRIQGDGYKDVRNLGLDASGIWRGMADKDGREVRVWLDYQGDVGQQ